MLIFGVGGGGGGGEDDVEKVGRTSGKILASPCVCRSEMENNACFLYPRAQ